ncbi:hypothetical protein [Gemmatimonas sp.]|uniref:hypothetical protein n=1 Tax=Gemmatimonas sp. TaxID=1962908 RepID=UPI00286DB6C1|nr:hypothetical protein [Gemmatimonas sp.]
MLTASSGPRLLSAQVRQVVDLTARKILDLDRTKTIVVLQGGMLEEQGFRWVLVVYVHGSRLHIGALDGAGDFFHDTYGGTVGNLWGLRPVLGGWGGAMTNMTAAERAADSIAPGSTRRMHATRSPVIAWPHGLRAAGGIARQS